MKDVFQLLNRNRLPFFLSVFVGSVFLLIPAFRNGYPLLYSDTCSYVDAGFRGLANGVRPMTYGFFLRHFSLLESFWLVIWVQGLIVSWLIHEFLDRENRPRTSLLPLASILLLSLTTGLGMVTSMLMPDFLTSVMLLSGVALFFRKDLSWPKLLVYTFLFYFSIASHHSHGLIMVGTLACYLVYWGWQKFRKNEAPAPQRLVLAAGLWLAGFMTIPALNYTYSGQWYRDKASHVFMINRFHEAGLLKPFLDERCEQARYDICPYKDNLPDGLLWGGDTPTNKDGGWEAHTAEYNRLIRDFLSTPKYLFKFMVCEIENGVNQFFSFEGQLVFKEREEGAPYKAINAALPEEIPAIRRALQYHDTWSNREIDLAQRVVVFGSFLLLLVFFYNEKYMPKGTAFRATTVLIIAGLLANAFVCAGISMVDMRFQFRVVWLAPLTAILIWWNYHKTLSSQNHSETSTA